MILDPKRIFKYRDGANRVLAADPVAVEGVLVSAVGEDWWTELGRLNDTPPAGLMGEHRAEWEQRTKSRRGKIAAAVRTALNLPAYHQKLAPHGLTDLSALGTGAGFRAFVGDLVELAKPFLEALKHDIPFHHAPTYAEWCGIYVCRRWVARERRKGLMDVAITAALTLKSK